LNLPLPIPLFQFTSPHTPLSIYLSPYPSPQGEGVYCAIERPMRLSEGISNIFNTFTPTKFKPMKKTTLLSVALIVLCFQAQAQYTLLNDFNSGPDFVYHFDTKSQTMYYLLEYEAETAHFYNQDFSFHKSVTAPIIQGYEIYMGYAFDHVSTNIFNTDTLIEFSLGYFSDESSIYKVFIFNEDLDEIAAFDSARIHDIYQAKNGQIRMDITKYGSPYTITSTQTYLLQDAPTYVHEYTPAESILPAYPNPSRDLIHLPYSLEPGQVSEMKIFDMKGELIRTIKIGSHFNRITIDTSTFKPGMYLYRYENKTGKFMVN
jgi:hypothetical protein